MLSGFTARQSTCRVVRRVSLRYHPSHATQGPSESLLPIPTQRFFARMTPYRHLNLRLQDLRSWTNPIGMPILQLVQLQFHAAGIHPVIPQHAALLPLSVVFPLYILVWDERLELLDPRLVEGS